ncbi:MAG: peptidoglycan DD-metalloendopeptidase family protein [Armatimonadota bacterium]|nr:peptidoglycan DD-metalloendopeptidase family protein [Armatimonadota bacterium]MCX7778468.1 peptidoglycan DD-metalloendopeptidase family protein [Armatimonadota bacterium]MDW8026047.1 peptidoglycan DD-metalloendopeptidase family protein [Armatimonadota bacterium]
MRAIACIILMLAIMLTMMMDEDVAASQRKTPLPAKVKQLRARKAELERKKREALRKLREVKRKERSISDRLQQIQIGLLSATEQYSRLSGQLSFVRQRVNRLRADVKLLSDKLASDRERFRERLVSIYKQEPIAYVSLLLSSKDVMDAASRLYVLRKVIASDSQLIRDIEQRLDELQKKQRELEEQEERLRQLQEQVARQKRQMEVHKARQEKILRSVQSERMMYERYLREWEEESAAIERMLRALQLRGNVRAVPWRGSFVRPVVGMVTSGFGYRVHPVFKVVRFHTGIDIAADYGTPIRAAAGGTVVFSGWRRAYGLTVIIDHGNGIATLYAHCSRLYVSEGETVEAGQIIAAVGSTGLSTGPHLHFEVRRYGTPVNPFTVE